MEMEQKIMKKMRIVEPPKNRRCGNCWVLFLALLQVLGAVGIIVLISTCLTSTKDLPDEELSVSYSVCEFSFSIGLDWTCHLSLEIGTQ